jgi:phthiocerol/phenolphthiocerol synthesis type-I polyketide synthase E
VVSGPSDGLDVLQRLLAGRGVDARPLRISAAAHSVLVEPVVARFRDMVAGLARKPPTIPIASDHTGQWMTSEEATDPAYWAAHLRGTVRFADALTTLLGSMSGLTLLEVGPGRTLSTLARQHPGHRDRHALLTSLPHAVEETLEYPHVLDTAGRAWLAGHDLDWARLHDGEAPRRVPLPTYPFQRARYRVDPDPAVPVSILPAAEASGTEADSAPYTPPRSIVESQVAGAFATVLGVARAGAHDSFLDLGGDSLIAAQLTAWIRREYHVSIPIRTIFKTPTVAGIATAIEARTTLSGEESTSVR